MTTLILGRQRLYKALCECREYDEESTSGWQKQKQITTG